jgi:S1-C subfamily serine protease
MLDAMRAEQPLRSLEVEWQLTPLASARKLDLPEDWARRFEEADPERRQVLSVANTVAGSPAAAELRVGDLLLSVDGEAVNSFRGLERATQKDSVEVVYLRGGVEMTANIETVALDGVDIDRAVLWAGALLQAPHRELAVQRGLDGGGVYVAYYNFGSPASRGGLLAGRRIAALNGIPTPDLDAFIVAARAVGASESIRINTVTFNEVPEVITLELDEQYWPAYEVRRVNGAWQRQGLLP